MRTSRRLLLALALCLTLAATFLAAPPPTEAVQCGTEFDYYSDATYTEVGGSEVWNCQCSHSSWGIRTAYRVTVPPNC